ncbi:hypothetical protein ACQPZX_38235 [Actinoplanes sp. CA-142083]|uniref:hypothetical protein n=1 Tax=Actinoplanes sp. CA-142083 TaxID=3239903 RepID=UPI003D900569
MIRRPLALSASALALCLSITACTAPAAAPSASAPFDPAAALAASTAGIDGGGYTFSVTGPEFEVSGAVHTPSGSAEILSQEQQRNVNVTTRFRIAGGRTYLYLDLSGGLWDDLDRDVELLRSSRDAESRRKGEELGSFRDYVNGTYWMPPEAVPPSVVPQIDLHDPDVIGVKRLLSGVKAAKGDDLFITGTLDTSQVTEAQTVVGRHARAHSLPTGTAMPFQASLDAQGRIATLSLIAPDPADTWVIRLSEYGAIQPLTAPPADLVKKPSAAVLKLLRGPDLSKPA